MINLIDELLCELLVATMANPTADQVRFEWTLGAALKHAV
jgi:hypothetical protein